MTITVPSAIRAAAVCLSLAATPGWAQIPRPQDPKTPVIPKPAPPADPLPSAADRPLSPGDQAFVRTAVAGNHLELALAKLAQEKSRSDQVKTFAQRLERDHSQANDELAAIAGRRHLTLPSAGAPREQKKLEALSAAAFDRAYADAMVKDHKKDIAAFEQQAARATDPDLKSFVQKTLPTLREHLREAQTLRQLLGPS